MNAWLSATQGTVPAALLVCGIRDDEADTVPLPSNSLDVDIKLQASSYLSLRLLPNAQAAILAARASVMCCVGDDFALLGEIPTSTSISWVCVGLVVEQMQRQTKQHNNKRSRTFRSLIIMSSGELPFGSYHRAQSLGEGTYGSVVCVYNDAGELEVEVHTHVNVSFANDVRLWVESIPNTILSFPNAQVMN